eukprot:1496786-Rhodomonas_salina.1
MCPLACAMWSAYCRLVSVQCAVLRHRMLVSVAMQYAVLKYRVLVPQALTHGLLPSPELPGVDPISLHVLTYSFSMRIPWPISYTKPTRIRVPTPSSQLTRVSILIPATH